MSKAPGSVASNDHSWMKLFAAVAALPLALAACGGGGGGGGTPTPPQSPPPSPTPSPAPAPGVSIVVTPSTTSTVQGGAAITLVAAVTGSSATPTWTLTGPGTISASTGNTITYTPPGAGTLTANTTATISAAVTGATTQTVTLTITVTQLAGQAWTNATTVAAGNLLGVDYANGRFVAVSDQGGALTSTDGAAWTAEPLFTSNVATDHFKAYAITHFNTSTMVAVGSISPTPYTSSSGGVAYSTNGTTWTMGALPAGATPLHGVIGGGTRLVGLGETGHLYSSTDGHSWSALTTVTGVTTLNAGVYGNNKYVAVGDNGYIAASGDSVAWLAGQVVVVGGTPINLHGITWTGSMYVAVGDSGLITTSKDGSAWTAPAASAISGALRSVSASSTGEIVIVGDNGIETSEDGVHWTSRDPSGAVALNGVTFANGQFIAVGANSAIKTSSGS